jgi:hypothetical protein
MLLQMENIHLENNKKTKKAPKLHNTSTQGTSRNPSSYPLTVQRFLKSSLSGYADSGDNLKVSTCIESSMDRCYNTYNQLKDSNTNSYLDNEFDDEIASEWFTVSQRSCDT